MIISLVSNIDSKQLNSFHKSKVIVSERNSSVSTKHFINSNIFLPIDPKMKSFMVAVLFIGCLVAFSQAEGDIASKFLFVYQLSVDRFE